LHRVWGYQPLRASEWCGTVPVHLLRKPAIRLGRRGAEAPHLVGEFWFGGADKSQVSRTRLHITFSIKWIRGSSLGVKCALYGRRSKGLDT
jgi:hypothetical protein